MAEERDLWKEIAAAERLIANAHDMGKIQEEGELWLGLGTCYYFLDLIEEAISAFEQAISLLNSAQATKELCSARCCLGSALLQADRFLQAIPVLEEALRGAKAVGDEDTRLECLSHLGYALAEAGRPEVALAHQREALTLVRQRGDREAEINELGKLGNIYAHLERIPDALACHEQALALAREIGDRGNEASQLGNLGATYTDALRQPDQGLQYFGEALHLFQICGDRLNEAKTLTNMAGAFTKADRGHEALEVLEQAQAIAAAQGSRALLGWIASQRGKIYDQEGQTEQSVRSHEQALALKRGRGEGQEEVEDLSRLGMAKLSQGQLEPALAFHQQALALARNLGDRRKEAQQLDSIANVLRELGKEEESALRRAHALALFRELGDGLGEGRVYVNIATASIRLHPWAGIQGNKKKALAGWRMGHALLSYMEPSEAETVRRKIEALRQAEGELAFERLWHGSEGYLRWFSFQRHWLAGDLLRSGLPDDELERFVPAPSEGSAFQAKGTLLHQAVLQALASPVDVGIQHEARVAIHEALDLAHDLKDRPTAAFLLGALGIQYAAAGMWEESVSCHQQAQETFHTLEDWRNEMKAFLNLGAARLRLFLPGEAMEAIRKGWYLASLFEREQAPAIALRKMGVAYLHVGDASYAKRILEDALKCIQEVSDPSEEAHICGCLGLTCLELGYASKAAIYLEQAAHLARQLGNHALEQRYRCLLAIAMAVAGKFRVAQQAFGQLQADLFNRGEQALAIQGEVNLALMHLFQENLPAYLAHLRTTLDLSKRNHPAHNQVQHIIDQFEQSLAKDPNKYEVILNESTRLYQARLQAERRKS